MSYPEVYLILFHNLLRLVMFSETKFVLLFLPLTLVYYRDEHVHRVVIN